MPKKALKTTKTTKTTTKEPKTTKETTKENGTLPITKKQFNGATIDFINYYHRFPFLQGDDVTVNILNEETKELEPKPFRVSRYVKEYHKNEEHMIGEFVGKLISYETISKIIGLKADVIEGVLSGEIKDIDNVDRICIENFFNKDYVATKDNLYNVICQGCKKTCKQKYNVGLIQCNIYEGKVVKEKKATKTKDVKSKK